MKADQLPPPAWSHEQAAAALAQLQAGSIKTAIYSGPQGLLTFLRAKVGNPPEEQELEPDSQAAAEEAEAYSANVDRVTAMLKHLTPEEETSLKIALRQIDPSLREIVLSASPLR